MLEVGVLAVESPPFQNHEVRLEPVVPFVVLVDECGVDLLVAFDVNQRAILTTCQR